MGLYDRDWYWEAVDEKNGKARAKASAKPRSKDLEALLRRPARRASPPSVSVFWVLVVMFLLVGVAFYFFTQYQIETAGVSASSVVFPR